MPRSTPAVSILLPIRNAADHLAECLTSLRKQSFTDFEVIAVDDGSNDNSPRVVSSLAEQDPRFRTFRRERKGLVATLNFGLANCTAPLVARMDADDRSHPNRIEQQVGLIERRPELTVVACLVEHFSEEPLGEGLRIYDRWLNGLISHEQIMLERFIESPIPHPASMFRAGAVRDIGGYQDRGWPEDYDLWLRLAASGHQFEKVGERLYFWRDHGSRLSRTNRRYSVERFLECKAEHLMCGPLRRAPAVLLWGAGPTGRRLAKHLLRRNAPLRGFVDIDPKKWGRTVRGVPVFAPDVISKFRDDRPGAVLLAAVSSRGARAKIRTALAAESWKEGLDYWCVA